MFQNIAWGQAGPESQIAAASLLAPKSSLQALDRAIPETRGWYDLIREFADARHLRFSRDLDLIEWNMREWMKVHDYQIKRPVKLIAHPRSGVWAEPAEEKKKPATKPAEKPAQKPAEKTVEKTVEKKTVARAPGWLPGQKKKTTAEKPYAKMMAEQLARMPKNRRGTNAAEIVAIPKKMPKARAPAPSPRGSVAKQITKGGGHEEKQSTAKPAASDNTVIKIELGSSDDDVPPPPSPSTAGGVRLKKRRTGHDEEAKNRQPESPEPESEEAPQPRRKLRAPKRIIIMPGSTWMQGADGSELCGWCSSCNRPRSKCFQRSDWACFWCDYHNFASRSYCKSCDRPRVSETYVPGGGFQLHRVCASHQVPMRECFRPYDWLCKCGAHNYEGKEVLRRVCAWVCLFFVS